MGTSPHRPVCWITGASSGIGLALAKIFYREGYDLILTARRADRLNHISSELTSGTGQVVVCSADVTDWESLKEIPQKAAEALGHDNIDVVIANAGVLESVAVSKLTATAETHLINVNVNGVINTIHSVLPGMLANNRGKIVSISSIAGLVPLPTRAAYTASKSAVIFYMDSLAMELKNSNITTTVVMPGYVESEMTANVTSKMPFLWTAERAAQYIFKGISREKRSIRFPWQLHLMVSLGNFLPRPVQEMLLRRQVSNHS
jgi:short-subunit dehydrogenase